MIRYYSYIIFILVLILTISIRIFDNLELYKKYKDGQRLKIRGYVTSQPYHMASKQILKVGWFQVVTSPFPSYFYGDYVLISGKLDSKVTRFGLPKMNLMNPSIQVLRENQAR